MLIFNNSESEFTELENDQNGKDQSIYNVIGCAFDKELVINLEADPANSNIQKF